MDAFLPTFLQQFQHLKIQLADITSATNNFDSSNRIGVGGFGPVYRGEVSHYKGRSLVAIKRLDRSHGQGTAEFLKEITMLSSYEHENLISLLGFCCEGKEMILVYELASGGSLDRQLNAPHLSWTQRIKICLDAAKGISYLHDPRTTHQRLIHCDIKSGNILLDEQWNAKVSDFGLSIMGPANEQHSVVVTTAAGTPGYIDPQYQMTHTLTKESDVYSFGVVLFEVLCGTLCCTYSSGKIQQILVPTWIGSYIKKTINDIVFKIPTIPPLDQSVLEIYSDIAYRCLKRSREDRPKMAEVVAGLESAIKIQEFNDWIVFFDRKKMTMTEEPPMNYSYISLLRNHLSKGVLLNGETTFLKGFEHLEIPLEEIISATNNFDDQNNRIEGGGSGKLYKGRVYHSTGRRMVTIKRLDRRNGEGTLEFLKAIMTLSRYKHRNIISLLGFCCERHEMILVYDLAYHGSLDQHLNSSHIMWSQRLKICLDVAKGLSYLHNSRVTHQGIIHGDLKSASILLDDQWKAKVADFSLSIMGIADFRLSPGYCDPQYAVTHTLTEDADLYSLGVVLFEVLCGTLCCTYSNGQVKQVLVPMWIESYKQRKLNDIIFKHPTNQSLDRNVLEIFSDIAYRCLEASREDRPKMSELVTKLRTAHNFQAFAERELLVDYEEMTRSAEPPLSYSSEFELWKLLSNGVLLNDGKTCFSISKNGKHCEMISFKECLVSGPGRFLQWSSDYNSRFKVGPYHYPKKPYVPNYGPCSDTDDPDWDIYSSAFIQAHHDSHQDDLDSDDLESDNLDLDKENLDEVSGCMPCSLSSLITYAGNYVKKMMRHSEYWTLKTRVKTQFLSPGIRYVLNLVIKFKWPDWKRNENERQRIVLKYIIGTKRRTSYYALPREDGTWVCKLCCFTPKQRIVDLEIMFRGYNQSRCMYDIFVIGMEFFPLP